MEASRWWASKGVEAGEDVVAAIEEGAVAEGGNDRGSSILNEHRAVNM